MIAACIKSIDDRSTHGLSPADEAAIEMALRHGEATEQTVIAVTVGGARADRGLRVALACGVKTAIRVDAPAISYASAGRSARSSTLAKAARTSATPDRSLVRRNSRSAPHSSQHS